MPAHPDAPGRVRAARPLRSAAARWYNNPGVDLVLYWSVLPPEGRTAFHAASGTITDDPLLCARILSLFLCATSVVYAYHEGMPELKREAVAGLDRTTRAG